MVPERQRRGGGVATASVADAAPLSFERRVGGARASQILPAEAELPLRCGVIKLEGKGDVRVQSATFLEGVEPQIKVVAAAEALRYDIAVPLLAPLSGVVCAANARGTEVEERTDRHHHARAAFSVVLGC